MLPNYFGAIGMEGHFQGGLQPNCSEYKLNTNCLSFTENIKQKFIKLIKSIKYRNRNT